MHKDINQRIAQERAAELYGSLDAQLCRKAILCCGSLAAVFALLFAGIALLTASARFLLGAIPTAFLFGFLAARSAYALRAITREPERYRFCETVLRDPQPWLARTICFSVTVTDEAGRQTKLQTEAIFATAGLIKPHFSDFNNKKVRVAYDTVNERVVVIRVY